MKKDSRSRSKQTLPRTQQRSVPSVGARGVHAVKRQPPGLEPPPNRDPTGEYHVKARALADELGLNVDDVIEEWDHRAAIRQYDGKTILDVANREAFKEVESWFRGLHGKDAA